MSLPLAWFEWLARDPEELEREARYEAMPDDIKQTAEIIERIYGRF